MNKPSDLARETADKIGSDVIALDHFQLRKTKFIIQSALDKQAEPDLICPNCLSLRVKGTTAAHPDTKRLDWLGKHLYWLVTQLEKWTMKSSPFVLREAIDSAMEKSK